MEPNNVMHVIAALQLLDRTDITDIAVQVFAISNMVGQMSMLPSNSSATLNFKHAPVEPWKMDHVVFAACKINCAVSAYVCNVMSNNT